MKLTTTTHVSVDGVMQGFLHNVYTGRRSGAGTTASATRGISSTPGVGVRALRLEPGTKSPEEIMRSAGEALFVQSVSGLHSGTNPISGDFSVGAEGLMVRDGAFAEPVREITVASTLQRMLLDITEVGSDLTFLPGAVAGSLGFSAQNADKKVEKLSGGEKARLMLGIATFGGPHLLILDEPTNHLDIDSRAHVSS